MQTEPLNSCRGAAKGVNLIGRKPDFWDALPRPHPEQPIAKGQSPADQIYKPEITLPNITGRSWQTQAGKEAHPLAYADKNGKE